MSQLHPDVAKLVRTVHEATITPDALLRILPDIALRLGLPAGATLTATPAGFVARWTADGSPETPPPAPATETPTPAPAAPQDGKPEGDRPKRNPGKDRAVPPPNPPVKDGAP